MPFENSVPALAVVHTPLAGRDLFVLRPDQQPEHLRGRAHLTRDVGCACARCATTGDHLFVVGHDTGLAAFCLACATPTDHTLGLIAPKGKLTPSAAAAFLEDRAWFIANPARGHRMRGPLHDAERQLFAQARALVPEGWQALVVRHRDSPPGTGFMVTTLTTAALYRLKARGAVGGFALDVLADALTVLRQDNPEAHERPLAGLLGLAALVASARCALKDTPDVGDVLEALTEAFPATDFAQGAQA